MYKEKTVYFSIHADCNITLLAKHELFPRPSICSEHIHMLQRNWGLNCADL